MKEKIVFMGTPDFAVPILDMLIKKFNVIGVVTQPDKTVGRKKELRPTPIKELAQKHNIKVLQPQKIKEEYQDILNLNPDIIITCAYGQIIPEEILNYPKHKCINVHASLLPKLRGGAPIHHAIIDGYDKTGITIMYMDEKMDEGDILFTKEIKIEENDTVGTLHDKLQNIGKELLEETLPKILKGNINPQKQNDKEATYAYNIKREEEKIDFNKNAQDVYNQIRGLNPIPGAYTTLDNKTIKIYDVKLTNKTASHPGKIVNIYQDGIGVSTKDKEIIIKSLKPEGKKKMNAKDYLNGLNKNDLLNKVLK